MDVDQLSRLRQKAPVATEMAAFRGFIAASLDGYIATLDGGVEWLKPFEKFDYGYDRFIDQIATVVMGRKTYDQLPSLGVEWPYPGKPGIVVTSRPLASPPQGVVAWKDGVERLIAHLRESSAGDVWVVGGAMLQRAMLDRGGMDRLELFVIPVLLGEGISLWPTSKQAHSLKLRAVEELDGGMVRLDYSIRPPRSRPRDA